MGKVTGAALKVAAPEAAVGLKAASKATGGGKDPRKTAPGSKAAQQRQDIEDLKAKRAPEGDGEDQDDEHGNDQADGGKPSLSSPLAGMQGPATGGGFVLGVMVWALVRAYIGNPGQPSGVDGMKRLLRAKFLNQTSPAK